MFLWCTLMVINTLQQYRKLMMLNDRYDLDVDHVDIAEVSPMDKDDAEEGETMLITFYLSILIILGVFMNGYAIFKTTKVG